QISTYEQYHDVVIVDTTSKTNQFDMILMLIIVVDNNFRNLIVASAIIEDETESTFTWILQELKNSCEIAPTEIQAIFNQQSKKAALTECKNEIPTKSIPTILDEYFPELDKILKEYLIPQILQKQRDQMAQSICYDAVLVDSWLPLLEVLDDSYQQEIAREDDYDQPQSLFPSLLEDIPQDCIQEVWKI
ncbi:15296_t:CDS:2, partial [Cetraspora pellucida]